MNRRVIKEEQQKIIGITPVVDMKHFVLLVLADLASKSPIVNLDGRDTKTACLNVDYKRMIEEIMYQDNGRGIMFASLINIYSYYEFQAEWERKLSRTLKKVLTELNKEVIYDYENDVIKVNFSKGEIANIKNNFDDETLELANHFTNLLNDPSFTRNFDLNIREMNRNINRRMNLFHEFTVSELRRKGVKDPVKYIGDFKPIRGK